LCLAVWESDFNARFDSGGGVAASAAAAAAAAAAAIQQFKTEIRRTISPCNMIALLFFIAISSSALSASQFGLEVGGTHSSGCLIVKNATGKAAACGVRHLDLVCSIDDKVVSKQEALSLSDATPCSRLVIKRHSLPCAHVTRSIPAGNGIYDIGLSLKAQTHTRASDPSAITTQYIVDASLSSDFAVEAGDWVRTVGGLLLFNKSPEQVKKIMSGARASVVEVCWWSADVRLEDISSGTSSDVLLLSAAAVLIFSFLALQAEAARQAEIAKQEAARKVAAEAEAARQAEIAKQQMAAVQTGGELHRFKAARQAEIARQQAEAARQAEIAKQQAEAARQAEIARQQAEAARQAEIARQQAEAARQAEIAKQQAEAARKAEIARQQAEGELHRLDAVQTGGGGDCLFHALVGALQDFCERRQHSDYLGDRRIALPQTHQDMRRVVVSFASKGRRMDKTFIDSGQYITLEQAVETDCRSHHGNNVVLGSEGNVPFHSVDEYFQVRCCFALVSRSLSKATPDFQIMRRDGSWGQHFEVMAAAAFFQVCIEVHRPGPPGCTAENNVVQVFGQQDLPRIYFRNKQEQHYEWMRPLYAREV
jgi:hypothetical protein